MREKASELSPAEMIQFRTWVTELENSGWSRTQLSRALGYAAVSSLSTIMIDESKSASRLRYDALRLLHEEKAPPSDDLVLVDAEAIAKSGRRRGGHIPPNEVKVFRDIYKLLIERGVTRSEIAQACGYKNGDSLFATMHRGKIPSEAFAALKRLAESDTVQRKSIRTGLFPPTPVPAISRPATPPPVVHRAPLSQGASAFDYFNAALKQLQGAKATLEQGIKAKAFKQLLEPGVQRAISGIEQYEKLLEEMIS